MKQPGVIVLGDTNFFLKVETEAIQVKVSFCAEAMAYLCALYYVFQCAYPDALHIVFGLFEWLLEIHKPYVKANATISNIVARVNAMNLTVS